MHSLLLWAVLTVSANPLPDGSLIFLENCNSVVEYSTKGKIGHVALVFNDADTCWVYEATPGEVRRVKLNDYYVELARINRRRDDDDQMRVWALQPTPAYSDAEAAAMREVLAGHLGRRYSLRNYVRTKPGDGIHCAELASTVLNASPRFVFENNAKIHPAALYSAIEASPHYGPPEELTVAPLASKEPWCARAQRRTGEIFAWCGWSCKEAWLWCW
jgi:hypothetical protein